MAKNIILCSDGTGNKGGYTPDSNVYKMYNAIEIHDTNIPQYTFYDNGIGTSTNKFWRAVTGALGFGIKQNIMDLYRFLSLHYEPGDKVYLFGFSRGAATIRAFCGFISAVGLVNGKHLSDDQLEAYTCDAFKAYENHRKHPQQAAAFAAHKKSHGIIDIHFVGVWDTVSALGFPQRTDITGFGLYILNLLFVALDKISDRPWPHRFYNYELTDNVLYACQALAIDDERTAFWPMVWDESQRQPGSVEQVWFSGMHSNVGGGYARQGMANVTFHWMLLRAQARGMTFKPDVIDKAYRNSNIHGRLYNSRDGWAIYYRYHPRNIHKLCKNKLQGPVKIHCSTLERMRKRTANYAPVVLPEEFHIVQSSPDQEAEYVNVSDHPQWQQQQKIIEANILKRKWLYGVFVEVSLLAAFYIAYILLKEAPEGTQQTSGLLDSFTSLPIQEFLSLAISNHPAQLFMLLFLFAAMFYLRRRLYKKTQLAAERIRMLFIEKITHIKRICQF